MTISGSLPGTASTSSTVGSREGSFATVSATAATVDQTPYRSEVQAANNVIASLSSSWLTAPRSLVAAMVVIRVQINGGTEAEFDSLTVASSLLFVEKGSSDRDTFLDEI